jgi:MraZ protein
MSPTRADIRNYKRLFYGRAERVDLDSQGRIRIPDRLVAFANLQKDVVLIGVHDHVEIWDTVTWQQFLEKHTTDFDSMAAGVFD